MSLPDTVRVKLSSEAAEYVSLTPVVVQEMPLRELVEHMLGITGKDEARIRDLLLRGTLVSGASRFRWTGWEADGAGLRSLLTTFPDPNPSRAFDPERCVRAVLRGPRQPIDITRQVALRRGLMASMLRRPSFWDALIEAAGTGVPAYNGYSYRDRADVYQLPLAGPAAQRVRDAARLVRYTALEMLIRNAQIQSVEFYVPR
jgi:hypothetical protein